MPILRFEKRQQKLAPRRKFLLRLVSNFMLVLLLVGVSLLAGMCGYHYLDDLNWLDSFENASMILSGMGPVDSLKNDSAKLFAGLYAIYSGIAVIASSGLLLAPLLHRVMHSLHAANEEDEEENEKKKR